MKYGPATKRVHYHRCLRTIFSTLFPVYLTIRLRARDFYEVIVDEGEARINYRLIEIESE